MFDTVYVLYPQFKKSVTDKLKKPTVLPFSHIGIQWKGSPAITPSGFVRKINLLGMTGPDNYFNIFLPEEAVKAQQSQEGVQYVCVCLYACTVANGSILASG